MTTRRERAIKRRDQCSAVHSHLWYICQLDAGHNGPHLDDRQPDTAVDWPQQPDLMRALLESLPHRKGAP